MRNKLSGIYKIRNLINDKCYIGSAVDLDGRKRAIIVGLIIKIIIQLFFKERITNMERKILSLK